MTGSEIGLLVRTAVHLQPGQIVHRTRLRAQRYALHRLPWAARWLLAGPDPGTAAGWPAGFVPLDALPRKRCELAGLQEGQIELLGMTRALTGPAASGPARPVQGDWAQADWAQADAPQLWRFHLHYWDWAWELAAEPDRAQARELFAAVWQSWSASVTPGRGDAWLPYPAALRAWSWCGIHRDLVAGTDIEDAFLASLAAHAGFVRRHLESDVGGNHLIKNLKALAGLAVFFADDQLLERALHRLRQQLTVQILPDGGHYERAPAYHCQVLGDLIDVADLLRAGGHPADPALTAAIGRMRGWLGNVLTPDGQVPLLNDGYPVDAELLTALRPGSRPDDQLTVLTDSGLMRVAMGSWHLLADVGAPCPDELPAHAHADTLGCLLYANGVPVLVDTGTSTYAPGPVRGYERSTAAHNTVEVDGTDSTEVWGAFRAARRARVQHVGTRIGNGLVTFAAVHDGYRGLPGHPKHRRRFALSEAGLQVNDLISGSGEHTAVVRWHLAPGSTLRTDSGAAVITGPAGDEFGVTITANCPFTLAAEHGTVASGFGQTVEAPVLTCTIQSSLPISVSTGWRYADHDQARETP